MNTENPILGASGHPLFSVGGPTAYSVHTYGDYNVSLEWHNDNRSSEPIMLIWSTTGGLRAGVFGICLSSAGKYADPSGAPTDECFFEAFEALDVLGRAKLAIEVKKLVDVIMRFIPDLILMPPSPREVRLHDARAPLLEITQTDENGKRLSEVRV